MTLPMVLAMAAGLQDTVENPEYAGWARQKPGASIRFEQTTDAGPNRTISEIRHVLMDVNPTRAVIEVRTRILSGDEVREFPLERREIFPRTVRSGTVAEGEEQIVVAGRVLKCRWIDEVTGRGKEERATKSWYCADVPGGLVRRVITMTRDSSALTTIVAEQWSPDQPAKK